MEVRKALVFRASSIGDCLMAKYFLENVHVAYPKARLGIVVASRGKMIRELLAAYPWIEIIETNRTDFRGLLRLWNRFHGSDVVLTQYAGKPGGRFSLRSKIAARLLARKGGLIGFFDTSKWNRFLYDKLIPLDIYRAPRLLESDALRTLGIPEVITRATLIYIPQPELLSSNGLVREKYLVVHLFAGSEARGLSPQKRQELLDALAEELPDTTLVLTGSAGERTFIEKLTVPKNALVLAGKLSVQELAALIDRSAGMVSIGTGPSHMASHLGKPLAVLVTCVGRHWCGTEQFGDAAAIIFSAVEKCVSGHNTLKQFPDCLEHIDMRAVARTAHSFLTAKSFE